MLSRREAKKRAILKLLDRIPPKKGSFQRKREPSELPAPRTAPAPAPDKLA